VTSWGRRQQCEALDGQLAEVRAGRSRVLVVRGEPGIGKTALLGYAAEMAQAFQVARAEGAESVALLFGTRDPAREGDLARPPGLALAGLPDADAQALLASVLPGADG
jgi:hypothetical protein